jgi:hypothetical protein
MLKYIEVMSKNSLSPTDKRYLTIKKWYVIYSQIFSTLPIIMPKNFIRVSCGRSCGLRNIEELF